MARYQITGGKRNTLEHFWSGGKYHRVQFDEHGTAQTENEDVADYYKARESRGYSVWEQSE